MRLQFIGRTALLDKLDALFATHRLVTLVGPGGVGKTSVAEHWAARQSRPMLLCDLSESQSLADVAHAMAVTLGIDLGEAKPLEPLAHALTARGACLIVLDNAEDAIAAVGHIVATLLARTPEMHVLVTSRTPLAIALESICRVDPLVTDEAVALYAAAVTKRGGASLECASDADCRALVEALDGLPLAIALAAARSDLLSVRDLRERLLAGGGLDLLRRGHGDGDRHASLRRVVDDTWQRLSPAAQSLLAQCAAFAGEFDLLAAEAMCDVGTHATIDVLEELHGCSLLIRRSVATVQGTRVMLRLYAIVRDVAQERLAASGGEAEVRRKHAHYFISRAHAAEAMSADARWEALHFDFANLVAIVRHSHQADLIVAAALAVHPLLLHEGPPELHEALLQSALAVASADGQRAELLVGLAQCMQLLGRLPQALQALEDAQRANQVAPVPGLAARILAQKGKALWDSGQIEAARLVWQEALPIVRSSGDTETLVSLFTTMGYEAGRLELLLEALAVAEQVGAKREIAIGACYLGVFLCETGDAARAKSLVVEAEATARAAGDMRNLALILTHVGTVFFALTEIDEAERLFADALALMRAVGNRFYEVVVCIYRGVVALFRRRVAGQLRELQGALVTSRQLQSPWLESAVLVLIGAALAGSGHQEEAQRFADQGLALCPPYLLAHRLFLQCLAGSVSLLRAEHLSSSEAKKTFIEAAAEPLRHFQSLEKNARAHFGRTIDIHIGVKTLRHLLVQPSDADRLRVIVDADLRTLLFAGERVSFGRRKTLQRIVAVLIDRHRHTPGLPMSADALADSVWPGVKNRSALHNRLYNAVFGLRGLGLRALVCTREDGYLIDPRVDIVEEK